MCNGTQPAKGRDLKMRRCKLRGGVNWQGAIKQQKQKQMAIKQDLCAHTFCLFWGSAMQFLLQTL